MLPRMRRCQRTIVGFAVALSACAPSWPAVIDQADIYDIRDGRPHISQVRDLGAVHIGRAGPLNAESDGQFSVGEYLLVEGSGFGRQPTLGIAGRPAEVLWRTAGGGIVAKVPPGSAIGNQSIWVQSGGGRTEAPLTLGRLAVVLDGHRGQVQVLRVSRGADGKPTVVTAGQPLLVPGARALALSYDGAAAYVLAAGSPVASVAIIDLVASGGPRIAELRQLRHAAHLLAAADHAGTLAIVGNEHMTVWDVREARRPATWPPAELPAAAKNPRAAALHPDGAYLALTVPEDNQVLLVDVRPGHTEVKPRQVAALGALPGMRQPLLHDLRFTSDGTTLWLSSGDNAESLPAGHQPTRITAIELKTAEGAETNATPDLGLSVLKTIDLRDAGGPVQLALSRTPPVSSGATIRTPPEKATVFLTTVASSTTRARPALWRSDLLGHITQLDAGKADVDSALFAGLDISPDARLAVTQRIGRGAAGRTLAVTDLETQTDVTMSLGPSEEADLHAPYDRLRIALQP